MQFGVQGILSMEFIFMSVFHPHFIVFQAGDIGVILAGDYNHFYNNTLGHHDVSGGALSLLPGDNNIEGDPLFTSVTDGSEDFTPLTGSPLIRAYYNGGNIGAVAHLDGGGGSTYRPRLREDC